MKTNYIDEIERAIIEEKERIESENRKERELRRLEDKKRVEKNIREERERYVRKTALIIKCGRNSKNRGDLELCIKEKIGKREIKILVGAENKEAAKVYFLEQKGDRDEIWERRMHLKVIYDMRIDEWLNMKETKTKI